MKKPIKPVRRRRQAAAAQSELRRILDFIPDMVCTATPDGYFKTVNPAFVRTLGYSQEELLATSYLDLIHPDDRQGTIAEVQRQLAGQATVNFENRYRCNDGTYKILEWQAMPAADGVLYAVARDITERKWLDGVMRLQSQVTKSIAEGVYLVSAENLRILYANPKVEEMFGYEPGGLNGQHVSIINATTEADPVQTARAIEKALRGPANGEAMSST
jgi:PAS domain S-box-containing protein